jgi:predicted MFS family arabinose efflux permease
MKQQSPHHISGNAPLYWLALGTFAVGTESFMVAGLLPGMASDLAVSIAAAGQLVTAFAFAYALSSPILTALTSHIGRRTLLILAMGVFALANLIAWSAQDYRQLMAARIVLAFAAGLYVPGANALASAVAAPERRGRAIAIVNGGLSLAIAFGVPLGALIGDGMGWRATFGGVVAPALATAAASFLLLSISAHLLPRSLELAPLLLAVIGWGVAHWAFYPAQQTTLVGVAGAKAATIVLSLNASFMYFGFSLGAGLGTLTLTYGKVIDLGLVSAASMVAALALSLVNGRRRDAGKALAAA